jgi:hypothetical protein
MRGIGLESEVERNFEREKEKSQTEKLNFHTKQKYLAPNRTKAE